MRRHSESVAIEDPAAFFPVLHAVTSPDTAPRTSPEQTHQHVFDTALALGYLSQPGAYVAAEMHLALHAASPKLEAFYQYYTDHHAGRFEQVKREGCGSWVDWYGEVVCDVEMLKKLGCAEVTDADDAGENSRCVEPFSYAGACADSQRNRIAYVKLLPFDCIQPASVHTLVRR